MKKNGRIKKIGCLGAYSFVLFLFAFDCLYFWVRNTADVVKPFSLRGSVIRQMSCNFFLCRGSQCILAKPQKKSIL